MSNLDEIKNLIEQREAQLDEYRAADTKRLQALETRLEKTDSDLTSDSKRLAELIQRVEMQKLGAGGGSFETAEHREAKKLFLAYLRTGNPPERKSMSAGSDPDGGYLVPHIIDTQLSQFLREMSPMRQLARVVAPESADYSMIHSVGGTAYSWVGETDSRPQTAGPTFQEIKPPGGEIYAMPGITQRLLDDNGFDLENWLVTELGEALGTGEGDAFVNGNGVGKPRGLLTYDLASTADGTRADTALQYVASGASGAFTSSAPADKLVSFVHTLKPRYRQGASWLMNTATLAAVRTLKLGTGDYLWRDAFSQGQPGTILGYPVAEDENMPDMAADSLSIAFGNFQRGYTIVDRPSHLLRDPFSSKPLVLFYSVRRVAGAVRDTRAIKLMKFATS